jgi:molybdopterin converting factor small subunit
MVRVKVKGYLRFKALAGKEAFLDLEIEKATLRDALNALCSQRGARLESVLLDPSTNEIRRSNLVLLNGQPHLSLGDKLDTELQDDDEIVLCPVLAGG